MFGQHGGQGVSATAWESWCRPIGRLLRRFTSLGLSLALFAVLLAACTRSTGSPDAYGGAQNHVHDLLALRGVPHTVLLATHIGLYRSGDGGSTWKEVAGGASQVMDGLMFNGLAQSPVDAQRLYVVAIRRPDNPGAARDTPGVYTSDDAGNTWTIATPDSAFPVPSVFTIGTGAATPGQIFALLRSLGSKGIYMSTDAGGHWQALPSVPTAYPSGIEGDPANPQRILVWSIADGLFISDDAGKSWRPATGAQGGMFSVALAGSTVYASGDAGLYVSHDGGAHLSLVESDTIYDALGASGAAPTTAYALAGGGVYVSGDHGQTWEATAATSRRVSVIAVDPADPRTVFVGLSNPLGVERTADGGAAWHQVLP